MYYLYLPVAMLQETVRGPFMRIPPNLMSVAELLYDAVDAEHAAGRMWPYVYISARKGWATPDAPLNRPGWHCDGFGTTDMNYVWWSGPGTRFWSFVRADLAAPPEPGADHIRSLEVFEQLATNHPEAVWTPPERMLYQLDPYVIHATPIIEAPGCMRQFVKISFSREKYNLYGNSHNYLFDYDWPMVDRDTVRNDTTKAGRDYG